MFLNMYSCVYALFNCSRHVCQVIDTVQTKTSVEITLHSTAFKQQTLANCQWILPILANAKESKRERRQKK